MQTAVRSKTITQGLKYSLATGNWGANKTAGTRSGVSQVYFIKYILFMRSFIYYWFAGA